MGDNNGEVDSEWMDGPLEELRLLWEKANKLKKYGINSSDYVKESQQTTSSVRQTLDAEKENKNGKHSKDRVHPISGKVSCTEKKKSHISGFGKSGCNSNLRKTTFANSDLTTEETKHSDNNAEQTAENGKHHNTKSFQAGARCSRNAKDKAKPHFAEHNFPHNKASIGGEFENCKHPCEKAHVFRTQHPAGTKFGADTQFRSDCSNSVDKENIVFGEGLFRNRKPTGETLFSDDRVKNDVKSVHVMDRFMASLGDLQLLWEKANKMKFSGFYGGGGSVKASQPNTSRESTGKDPLWGMPDLRETRGQNQDKVTPPSRESSFGNPPPHMDAETESKGAGEQKDSEVPLHNEADGNMDTFQDCLINNREKLKETDEYKQAEEEEWAARQQALRHQAEDVRKMRQVLKEKKTECLLNMERRQKQRVEEALNTQKKVGEQRESKEAGEQKDNEVPLHDGAGGDSETFQDCIINNRENHKETDEYKRAEEEEWASRQEALRCQAEEARKMRQELKRKKTESSRLQDMQRRQKQRVEEIRLTQKQDEENMNLKEKLRAEVRMTLKQLENKSFDMASLLRGLGIHVNGGLKPQMNEIRAAYRQAVLSFHPDRAPASDIRKLVEAEEKFKLISRMKKKFLPSS